MTNFQEQRDKAFVAKFVEPIDAMARALNLNGDAYVMGRSDDVISFLHEDRKALVEEIRRRLDEKREMYEPAYEDPDKAIVSCLEEIKTMLDGIL